MITNSSLDTPNITLESGPTSTDALHNTALERTATPLAPDATTALPVVAINHDRTGIAGIGDKDHPLNNGASTQDLTNYGFFGTKGDAANLDTKHPDKLRTDQDKINTVNVASGDTSTKGANFIVGANGSITVLNNPDNNKDKALTVVLDKTSGSEPDAQKKAADALVAYLEKHYDILATGINDPNKLLSDAVKTADTNNTPAYTAAQRNAMNAALGGVPGVPAADASAGVPTARPALAPGTPVPPPSPANTEGGGYPAPVGGYPGGPGGYPRNFGGYPGVFPRGAYPAGIGNNNYQPEYPQRSARGPIRAYDNAALSFPPPPATDTTQTNYSFSGNLLASWLRDQGFDPDSPETPNKLKELAKTNPVLAAELSKAFAAVSQLKADDRAKALPPGALPQDLAAKVARDEVEKFSKDPAVLGADGKLDAGKLALALDLGHAPTATDLQNPANQKLMEEARTPQANQAILASAESLEGQACWEGTGVPPDLGCAISATKILQAAGIKDVYATNTIDLENQLRAHGAQVVDAQDRKPGDLIFFEPNGGHGHVAVYKGGDIAIANDSSTGLVAEKPIENMAAGRNWHYLRVHPDSTDSPAVAHGGTHPHDTAPTASDAAPAAKSKAA